MEGAIRSLPFRGKHFIGEAEFAEPGGDFFLLTLTEVGFELAGCVLASARETLI